jgi:nucleoside-diphosphate-sugar epimerase
MRLTQKNESTARTSRENITMGHHIVLGAGAIGRLTAAELVELGHEVTLISRSGTQLDALGVRTMAADGADVEAMSTAAYGADSIVNAMNPKYTQWARDWPPVAASLLIAAERTGAGLVTVSNLYAYGRVAAPMTEQTPLAPHGTKGQVRAAMWEDALAAHQSGRVRATELRASDYFGAGAAAQVSFLNTYVIAPAARGKSIRLIMGSPDATHSWTYLPDIATLAARLATDDRSWGRAWHVPSAPSRTIREVAAEVAALSGRTPPSVDPLPKVVKRLARVVPVVRELDETAHQFERPFVLDATAATETFGVAATEWDQALKTTIAALTRDHVQS